MLADATRNSVSLTSDSILSQVTYAALNGMRLLQYDVETPDGWILQIWRLQSPEIFHENLSAPILLSHSFGWSALHYMMNARNESIAFILADNGYDVFLTNYRGNPYSLRKMSEGKPVEPELSDYYRCG